MEDTAIVALYWDRDQRAITASDEKYGGQCRALSANLLGSREDAEECVNDTWHRAWDTMPPKRPDSLRAYLLKIVRNLSIDRWRSRKAAKRGAGVEALVLELEDCLPSAPSAERETEARLVTQCIDRWLDSLPQKDRVVFVRRYWYGDRVDELAKREKCSANRMAQKLRRLRLSLKEELEREGVTV